MYVPLNTVQHAVSAVDSLADVLDPARFADTVLAALARLVACEVVTYHEMDAEEKRTRYAELRPSDRIREWAETGIRYRLSLTIPAPGGTVIGIVFIRADRPFTDVERDVLTLLREPILGAFLRARRHRASALPRFPAALTGRERQILDMVTLGMTNGAIARSLGVSPRTVAKHLEHVYRKLGVGDRAAAVARVLR